MKFRTGVRRGLARATAAAMFALGVAACDSTGPDPDRTFDQVQRLGNPLVSEVLLMKASHPIHGTTGPAEDAQRIAPEIVSFITGPGSVAGRSASYASLLGSVLLPDMLILQTDKPASTAGWLTWIEPLGNGFGGRKLSDDVVDLALLAVFGDPFGADPAGAQGKEGLRTDNVGSDSPFLSTFPYVAPAN